MPIINCCFCNKEFYKKPSHIARCKNNFCSYKCMGDHKKGKEFSTKTQFKKGHLQRTRWNGGEVISLGYKFLSVSDHPFKNARGYVQEHRLVMEKFLGRYLERYEIIHHIDGNKLNNNIKNLMLFSSHSDHLKYHAEIKRNAKCSLCS